VHCNDVSTFEPVELRPKQCKKCEAKFPKRTVPKTEKICKTVPRIICDLEGYVKCDMEMVPLDYKETVMADRVYTTKVCEPKNKTITHIKKKPECKTVTKHNCVTKWEVLESGEKVWSGNDDCKEVTWQECTLIDVEVDFNITEIECSDGENVPWRDCEQTINTQMTMNVTCTPGAALTCKTINEELCVTVKWDDAYQEVDSTCTDIKVSEPYQEVSHKKKCLLSNPDADLDTDVLKDLELPDKVPVELDDPICEKGPFGANCRAKLAELDSSKPSDFKNAVKRLSDSDSA
jgi:hypothetical protein